MSERLAANPWIAAPATVAVLDALEAAGGAGCARFVGGCVRNSLIGAPMDDIDIATTLAPQETIRALEAAGLRAVPTGVEHGTVTAISDHRPFEITTLRRDVQTDGRHAVVAFTDDWGEDAKRRDFTLNALYADRDGAVVDPTGHGIADARAGRIVFVGEPEARIAEDHLRILRFFRFFAWYGKGDPDPAAVAACQARKDRVASLAAERISKELLKLLAAPDPRRAVGLMARTGVLATILPPAPDLARFARLVEIEAGQLFEAEPVLRLAALLPGDPAAAVALAQRLRLSGAERDRLAGALATEPALTGAMTPREVRRLVYRQGAAIFRDRAKLAWAAAGTAAGVQWRGLIAVSEAWTPPVFPLTGGEVMAAGLPKGPQVGHALREVEDWWVDQDFPDDPTALAKRLEAVIQGMGR
jgi:poly(A) polymerase